MNGWTHGWIDLWMDGPKNGWTYGWIDLWMDGPMDGPMNGWTYTRGCLDSLCTFGSMMKAAMTSDNEYKQARPESRQDQ